MSPRFPIRFVASSGTGLGQQRRIAAGGGGVDADVPFLHDMA